MNSSSNNSAIPAICTDPQRDNCSFYPVCVESRYHCGPSGYPIGYGLRYCEKFREERDKLSAEGQDWMLNTMLCLQRKLIPYAVGGSQNTTCED